MSRCADIDLNLDGAFGRQHSVAERDPFLAFSSEDLAGMDKEVMRDVVRLNICIIVFIA